MVPQRPPFTDLPLDKSGPRGNAWGLFGQNDELGLLNYITPQVTLAAIAEAQHGIRVCTDLPLDFFKHPAFNRPALHHEIKQLGDHTLNDDTITFNPQSGTQWDGFRHFGYQDCKQFFQGCRQDEIHSSTRLGIHVWQENGGIATRGVLLDYAGWAAQQGNSVDCHSTTNITAHDLRQVMDWAGVALRQGDVLMIRSGFLAQFSEMTEEACKSHNSIPFPPSIGLEQSREMLQFLWESGVVAVAGDMPTLEAWPWQNQEYWLHEWLLAGWGCPIGELFDLEKLARECARLEKWTFFFTSSPLNIPGGVASPVNGMAIL